MAKMAASSPGEEDEFEQDGADDFPDDGTEHQLKWGNYS